MVFPPGEGIGRTRLGRRGPRPRRGRSWPPNRPGLGALLAGIPSHQSGAEPGILGHLGGYAEEYVQGYPDPYPDPYLQGYPGGRVPVVGVGAPVWAGRELAGPESRAKSARDSGPASLRVFDDLIESPSIGSQRARADDERNQGVSRHMRRKNRAAIPRSHLTGVSHAPSFWQLLSPRRPRRRFVTDT